LEAENAKLGAYVKELKLVEVEISELRKKCETVDVASKEAGGTGKYIKIRKIT